MRTKNIMAYNNRPYKHSLYTYNKKKNLGPSANSITNF